MKKVVYSKYGPPGVLQIINAEIPVPGKNEILVRVGASSINAIDWKNRQGRFRLMSGLFKPKVGQGFDVAGIVTKAGESVEDSLTGKLVIGQIDNFTGGAFAEYVILKKGQYIEVPDRFAFTELAALPLAATTAWQALVKLGGLNGASSVLVNGGSSGVGHYAIQIAKGYGAKVTAVCSSLNSDLCYSLGADRCIDYTKSDFTQETEEYDIVFDVVNNSSLGRARRVMKAQGVFIGTTPTFGLLSSILFSLFTDKKAKFVAVSPDVSGLRDIYRLMENGQLKSVVDKVFPIEKIVEAHQYSEQSRTAGKVVITVNDF